MRIEQIIDAVITALTGLTTTGTNIYRGQTYDIEQLSLPALVIYGGADEAEQQLTQSFIDWKFEINIDVVARGDSPVLMEELNTVRGEIHAALMFDYTLGLSFVHYIEANQADQPVISSDGNRPIARQNFNYNIFYRTNWNDLN